MGWKSTITITKDDAIRAIMETMNIENPYSKLSAAALEQIMYDLGIGEDYNKPYFGHNFEIIE